METLDPTVVDAYVAHYPSLRWLAASVRRCEMQGIRAFAQNACRLALPPGVSLLQCWELAKHCVPSKREG